MLDSLDLHSTADLGLIAAITLSFLGIFGVGLFVGLKLIPNWNNFEQNDKGDLTEKFDDETLG